MDECNSMTFVNASKGTTVFTMSAKTVAVTLTLKKTTYTLAVTAPTIGPVYAVYAQSTAQPITIRNLGNSNVTMFSVRLSSTGASCFTQNRTSGATIKTDVTGNAIHTV